RATGLPVRLTVGGWRSIVYVWVWIAETPPVAPTPRTFAVVVVAVPAALDRAIGPLYSWVGGVGGLPAAGATGAEPSEVTWIDGGLPGEPRPDAAADRHIARTRRQDAARIFGKRGTTQRIRGDRVDTVRLCYRIGGAGDQAAGDDDPDPIKQCLLPGLYAVEEGRFRGRGEGGLACSCRWHLRYCTLD